MGAEGGYRRQDRGRSFVEVPEGVELQEGVAGADALTWPVLKVGHRKTKSYQRESRAWFWRSSVSNEPDEPMEAFA